MCCQRVVVYSKLSREESSCECLRADVRVCMCVYEGVLVRTRFPERAIFGSK